jgi:hypothetical protein
MSNKFIWSVLGAQIISVSTIDINEQPFIKTIYQNADSTENTSWFVNQRSGELIMQLRSLEFR